MTQARTVLTTSLGLLVLRIGTGGFMATHGWGKVQMVMAGEMDKLGDPLGLGPGTSLVLAALAEFVGALLVVVGLGTRIAAASIVFTMGVAAFVIHSNDPWTTTEAARLMAAGTAKSMASKQPALMFLIPCLALVLTGAGQLSLDCWLWKRWQQRRATS